MPITATFCPKSAAFGLILGALCTAAAWYGTALNARVEITQAMLAEARCDPAGFKTITFPDGSQFTCVPAEQMPPTSRAEAAKRQRGGRG
jgi:hypothetical protein